MTAPIDPRKPARRITQDDLRPVSDCPKCGDESAFDDLHPDWIAHADILMWRCRCGYCIATRTVEQANVGYEED